MKHGLLKFALPGFVAVTVLGMTPAKADILRADLSGFNETPATLSSPASADFRATINRDETEINYTISYKDFPTAVTQSHLHLGRRATTGGVMVFLCTNLGNGPAGTPLCPASPATVSGTLTAAQVVGGANAQGIAPGEFAEVVRAIRNGAAYANVHSTQFPGGEVRDQVKDFFLPHRE